MKKQTQTPAENGALAVCRTDRALGDELAIGQWWQFKSKGAPLIVKITPRGRT